MVIAPEARTDRLLIKELGDELVVYDLDRERALCLSSATASVWRRCDGKRGLSELTDGLAADTSLPADDDLVLLALDRLKARGLLKKPETPEVVPSRREVALRLGLAAGMLPIILSLPAPTLAQTVSCLNVPAGRTCPANRCGVECGGPTCGSDRFFCKKVGTNKYRCVPPTAGTCP